MNFDNTMNELIVMYGTMVYATKLPIITIGLGPVKYLKEVPGVIRHTPDGVELVTKKMPDGILYQQDLIALVRIINSKVLMNGGMYDLYCPSTDKLVTLLSNPIQLTASDFPELAPLLEAASEVMPSLAPADYSRNVVVITEDLISKIGAAGYDDDCGDYILCRNEWDTDPNSKLCRLYVGDVFIVTDALTAKGHRIGREEFSETYYCN